MLPDLLIGNFQLLLQGTVRTLLLSGATVLLSTAIGLAASLLRTFGWWPLRVAVDVYVYRSAMEFTVGVAVATDPNSGVRFSLIPLEGIALSAWIVQGIEALGSKNDLGIQLGGVPHN